jgi:hypothetical protein
MSMINQTRVWRLVRHSGIWSSNVGLTTWSVIFAYSETFPE